MMNCLVTCFVFATSIAVGSSNSEEIGSHMRELLVDSNGKLSNDDKKTILNQHNDYRNALCSYDGSIKDSTDTTYPGCSDMNYLFWDEALEKVAQDYADHLAGGCYGLSHNSDRVTDLENNLQLATFDIGSNPSVGENLAFYGTTSNQELLSYYTNGVTNWWEEHEDWSYQTITSNTNSGVLHFTQMASANTRYIGCAGKKNSCNNGWNYFYLVCNYFPAGNIQGQAPYTSIGSASCSSSVESCDNDRTDACSTTSNSLCGGCMDPEFTSSGSTSNNNDCCNGFVDVSTGSSSGSSCSNSVWTFAPTTSPTPSPVGGPTESPTESPIQSGCSSCSSNSCYGCLEMTNMGYLGSGNWIPSGCFNNHGYYTRVVGSDTYYAYKISAYGWWSIYKNEIKDNWYYVLCTEVDITACGGVWQPYGASQWSTSVVTTHTTCP